MVAPRVPRQPPLARAGRRRVGPVAERRRDDRARAPVEQELRMARDLGPRHREPHVGEEPARAALADVPLGLVVRPAGAAPTTSSPSSSAQSGELGGGHARILPVKAIRIHEDGGPEVLRYEDVPDPAPGEGEVLVRLARRVAEPPRRLDAQGPPFRAEAADPRRRRRRRRRGARRRRRRARARRPRRAQPRARARRLGSGARRALATARTAS